MATELSMVILTGLSGSGKTTGLHVLEDSGYFCIDNLPAVLLDKLIELSYSSSAEISKIGIVMDVRSGSSLGELPSQIEKARRMEVNLTVVFLDCADEIVARRYTETRRPHPLSPDGTVLEGIVKERRILSWIAPFADIVVDTTALTPIDLRSLLKDRLDDQGAGSPMGLRLVSFGYKYGLPFDADIILDARMLPNPFYLGELRPLTGLDEKVRAYVNGFEESKRLVSISCSLIEHSLPLYRRSGKRHLTVAVGCTGGRHRSVAIVREIEALFVGREVSVKVFDRDITR